MKRNATSTKLVSILLSIVLTTSFLPVQAIALPGFGSDPPNQDASPTVSEKNAGGQPNARADGLQAVPLASGDSQGEDGQPSSDDLLDPTRPDDSTFDPVSAPSTESGSDAEGAGASLHEQDSLYQASLFGETAQDQDAAVEALLDASEQIPASAALSPKKARLLTASLFPQADPVPTGVPHPDGYPRILDGSDVESISVKWITKDTQENGDDSLLYLIPGDDASFSVRFQVDYALSGEHNYNPGDIVIRIPAQVFHKRDSNTTSAHAGFTGNMVVPLAESPSTRTDFNWTRIGNEYVLTNTRTIIAATKGFVQFEIKDLMPHSIVDMSITDEIRAKIEVATHADNMIGLMSHPIKAQVNTTHEVVRANKGVSTGSPTIVEAATIASQSDIPAWITSKYPNEEAYVLVNWHMNSYHTGNQPYTLDALDVKTDGYDGFVLGYTNANGSNKLVDDVQQGWYTPGTSPYTNIRTAYPLSQFEKETLYTFTNRVTYTLTPIDGIDAPTTATATAQVPFSYHDPRWEEPTGHFNVFKWGNDNDPGERADGEWTTHNVEYGTMQDWGDIPTPGRQHLQGWYGIYRKALNELREGNDTEIAYTIKSEGYLLPWIWGGSLSDNPPATRVAENYGKRPVTMVTADTGLWTGTQTSSTFGLVPEEDIDFVRLNFVKPSIGKIKSINVNPDGSFSAKYAGDGTFDYQPDYDDSKIPPILLEVQQNGVWKRYATADWSSGSCVIRMENGQTLSTDTVDFPPDTENFRTSVTSGNAYIYYYVRPVVEIHPTQKWIDLIEGLFEQTNTPSTDVWNGVNMVAYDFDKKEIVDISKNGYDRLYGYTTDIASIPYKNGTVKDINYDERDVVLHYTARVEERSVVGDRDVYMEAIEDGIIPSERSCTWYDLLPLGLNPLMDTISLVRAGDAVEDAYAIPDFKGTGRTLLVVKASLTTVPETYKENEVTYYEDVPQIEFDAECDIANIIDHGTKGQNAKGETVFGANLHNVIVFESGNDTLGTVVGYRGETNDPNGTNNVRTREAFYDKQSGYEDTAALEALAGLNGGRDTESFLYAGAMNHVDILNAASTSIIKEVSTNNDNYWSTGVYYKSREADARDVYEGGMYAYRIFALSNPSSQTKNMVIYDSLENFAPWDGNHPEDVTAVEQGKRWRGTLRSVDVSNLTAKGVDAVVYYSTKENLQLQERDSHEGGSENATTTNLADPEYWTRADQYTGDLADVHAIAVDARKKTDGSDFILQPEEAVTVFVNMWAPAGEEASDYIERDCHAYNNVFLDCISVDAHTGGQGERHFIRQDYVKVGLVENEVTVNKKWEDGENRDGVRPGSVTYTLYRDGVQYVDDRQNPNVTPIENPVTVQVADDGSASHTFKYLPYCDDEGNVFTYSVRETTPEGYAASVVGSQDGHTFTVTNRHKPATTSVSGAKTWIDDADGTRPEAIYVDLYADGELCRTQKVVPDTTGRWSYSFDDVFKYRDGGIPIVYTVKERAVKAGSLDAYVPETSGTNIANTYHPFGNVALSKSILSATGVTADDLFDFAFSIVDANDEPLFDSFEYEILNVKTDQVKRTGTVSCDGVVQIGDDEVIVIKELPQGAKVTATEAVPDGYTALGGESRTLVVKANATRSASVNNIYTTSGFVNLSAKKTLSGRKIQNYQFRFNLTTDEAGADVVASASSRADGTVSFGALNYGNDDAGKTHTYYLHEIDRGKVGYTYDGTVYKVDVAVVDNGDGTMTCTPTYFSRSGTDGWTRLAAGTVPTFANEYHASGSLVLKAWKVLESRGLSAGEFSFQLVNSATGEVVGTAENAADGTITFPALSFTEKHAGKEYDYVMSEVKGTDNTVNYSDEQYSFHVAVVDNGDGTLSFAQDVKELELVEDTSAGKMIWARGGIENITAQLWMCDGVPLMEPGGPNANEYDGLALDLAKTYTCGTGSQAASYTGAEIVEYLMAAEEPEPEADVNYFRWDDTYPKTSSIRGGGKAMPDGLSYGQRAGSGLFIYKAYPLTRKKADEPATPVFTNTLKDGNLAVQKVVSDNAYGEFKFKVKLRGEKVPADGKYAYTKQQINPSTLQPLSTASAPGLGSQGLESQGRSAIDDVASAVSGAAAAVQSGLAGLADAAVSLFEPEEAYAADDDIASGTSGGVDWRLTSDNVLIIGKEGEDQEWNGGKGWDTYQDQVYSAKFVGRVHATGSALYRLFYGYANLTTVDLSGLDTSRVTGGMTYAFRDTGIRELDLSGLDLSGVTSMSAAFQGSTQLTKVVFSQDHRISNVSSMYQMFDRCKNLKSLDLSMFDTERVTSVGHFIDGCNSLEYLDISSFSSQSLTEVYAMMQFAYSLRTIKLGPKWTRWQDVESRSVYFGNHAIPHVNEVSGSTSYYTVPGSWVHESGRYGPLSSAELVAQYPANAETWAGTWNWVEGTVDVLFAKSRDASVPNETKTLRFTELLDYELPEYTLDESRVQGWVPGTADAENVIYLDKWYKQNLGSSYAGGAERSGKSVVPAGTKLTEAYTYNWLSFSDAYSNAHNKALAVYNLANGIPDYWNINNSEGTVKLALYAALLSFYDVEFKPGEGGSGSMSSILDHPVDEDFVIPAPTFRRFNYHVKEWLGSNGETYSVGETIAAGSIKTETLTLTAVWEPDANTVNMNDGEFEFTLKSNERATFPNIPAGTAYEVYEETPAGWRLVQSSNTMGSIEPIVTQIASFTNAYTPDRASIQLRASKTLDGAPAEAGKFSFALRSGSTTSSPIQTKNNSAGGGVVFDPITYTSTGTFTYYISEVAGGDPTIDYDGHSERVTVTVSRVDGKLVATASYDSDGATFANTTKPGSLELKKTLASGSSDEEFTFTVTFHDDGGGTYNYTGSKEGTIKSGGTITLKGGQRVVIGGIPAGTIYSVEESVPAGSSFVKDSSSGEAGVIQPNVTKTAEFVNREPSLNPQSTSAGINLEVRKTLANAELAAGQFQFKLLDADNNDAELGCVYNDASGKVVFDLLTYETAGEHHYKVVEVASNDANIDYDDSVKELTVTVAPDAQSGNLVANVTSPAGYDLDDEATIPTFANTHKTGRFTVSKTVEGATPAAQGKEFNFVVTFTDADGAKVGGSFTCTKSSGEASSVSSGSTITLKGGESATIAGVPVGVHYQVEEASVPGGFELREVPEQASGVIEESANPTAAFVNDYSAYGEANIVVRKTLDGRALAAGQFTFDLADESGAVVSSASNAADGTVAFPALAYTQEDVGKTFTYTVSEQNPGDAGYTYAAPLAFTVTVADTRGDGTLSTTVAFAGNKSTFANVYKATGELVLEATKKLVGRNLNNEQFGFEVLEGSTVVATGKNDASGKVSFTPIEYGEGDAGATFTYTIREVRPNPVPAGYTYDSHTESLTVSVADGGDGTMVATPTYDADGAAFENAYNPTPAEATLLAQKEISGRAPLATDAFTLRVTAEGTAPLRTQDGAQAYLEEVAKPAQGGRVDFANLVFTHDDLRNANGTYAEHKDFTYRIHEVCLVGGQDRNPPAGGYKHAGFTYAPDQTVTLRLTDTGEGKLEVSYADPDDAGQYMDSMEEAVFVNTYSVEPTQGQIQARKRIVDVNREALAGWKTDRGDATDHDWSGLSFTVELHGTEGAPMPAGTVANKKTAQVTCGGADEVYGLASFGEITYTTWGEWDYTIREHLPEGSTLDHPVDVGENLTHDVSVHSVHVKVDDNGDGTLADPVVTYGGSPDGDENPSVFTNSETGDDEIVLRGHKLLSGEALHEGEFSFVLYEADSDYQVEGGAHPVAQAANDENGSVSGIPREYTVDDIPDHTGPAPHQHTFYYVGREVAPIDAQGNGVTYENKDVRYAVTITEQIRELGHPEHNHVYVSKVEVGDSERGMTTVYELPYDAERTFEDAKADMDEKYASIVWPEYENSFAAEGSAKISLNKHIEGDRTHWVDGDAFTFQLRPLELADDPAPEGSDAADGRSHLAPLRTADGDKESLQIVATDHETVAFDELLFDQEDLFNHATESYVQSRTFEYEVVEVASAKGGFTLAEPHRVSVTVTNDRTDTLKVTYGEAQTSTFDPIQMVNRYDIDDEKRVELEASKLLAGRPWLASDSFELQLRAGENTADRDIPTPMPEGAVDGVATVKVTSENDDAGWEGSQAGTKVASFGSISFTRPGAYHYTITEVIPAAADRIASVAYAEGVEHTATVVATDTGDGTIELAVTYDEQGAVFENDYTASGTVALEASKVLTGRALADEQFSFELRDASGEVLQTVSNDAEGKVAFAPLSFDQSHAGQTFAYEIAEVVPSTVPAGYTYDVHVEKVTVSVADNTDGTLACTVAYDEDGAVFTNAYSAPGSVVLQATKTLAGRDLTAGQFEFQLEDSAGNVLKTAKNDASGAVTFGAVGYTQDDAGKTFDYVIREVVPDQVPAGYAYDKHAEEVSVAVVDNGDGTLSATASYDDDGAKFANSYSATGKIVLKAKKRLEGAKMKARQFEFRLLDSSGKLLQTAKNDASGAVVFDAISYTQADAGKKFEYRIAEVVPKKIPEGYTYDKHVEKVNVAVSDLGDGTLRVKEAYDASGAVFKNVYVPPDKDEGTKPPQNRGTSSSSGTAKTGDPLGMLAALFGAVAAACLFAMAFALRRLNRTRRWRA